MDVPRVVVLGATGFVAGSLLGFLEAEGQPIRAVGSREVDLSDDAAIPQLRTILEPGDALVICSALTPEHGRDRSTFLRNLAMVDHVCTVLSTNPCAQVVYIGSDSVYGCGVEDLNEQSCCEPGDFYGLAHLVREKMLQTACAASNIPLAVLRAGAIYGPGDTHNAYGPNRFVRTARETGKIVLFGQGEEQRDHIYIADVCRIIQLCIQHRTAGTFNAVSGVSLTFREIADTIAEAAGDNVKIESAPRSVPVIHRRFNPAALRDALPEFRPKTFESAIREMLGCPLAEPSRAPDTAAKAAPVEARSM